MPRARIIPALAAGLALAGCAGPEHAAGPASDAPAFEPTGLEERIFETATGGEISRAELLDRMASANVVYLGEKHDNARQHALQAEVIAALVERGRRPTIAFEVFPREQTSTLMRFTEGGGPRDAAEREAHVRRALGWAGHARDESWRSYGPLLELARAEGLHAVGIDLPRALRSRMARAGPDALTGVERRLLVPSDFEDAHYAQLVTGWLRESHCGHGDGAFLARLYRTWLERNETMADALDAALSDHEDEPVVVILGSGHTRHRMGVPERLARRRPHVRQLDLAFVETRPDTRAAVEYFGSAAVGARSFGPRHQYVWFTRPQHSGGNPCAGTAQANG